MGSREGAPLSLTQNLRVLFRLMSRHRKIQLGTTILLSFVGAIAELITIGATLPLLAIAANGDYAARFPAVESALAMVGLSNRGNLIGPAALFLIVSAIFSGVARLILTWWMQKFIWGLYQDISLMGFSRIIHQPYEKFVNRNSSTIISGLEKVHLVAVGIVNPLIMAFTSAIIAIFIITFLFFVDAAAAAVASFSMGALYVIMTLTTRRLVFLLSGRMAQLRTLRVKLMQESLGGFRDIVLDHSQPVFERKLASYEREMRRLQTGSNLLQLAPRFVVEACGIVLIALLALYFSTKPGGILAAIPVLGALALGAQRLLPLLQIMYMGWASYSINSYSLRDVLDLLEAPVSKVLPPPPTAAIQPFGSEIRLNDVSFSYGGDMLALANIDMTIRKGERIGLIGKTGSGKSTLVDLLMGLLRPTSGSLLLSGVPVNDGNIGNWQAQIAHVPQAIFLADDSIAANITFGLEDSVDMDRIWKAVDGADLRSFVEQLPEGIFTRVGERGVRLSGGQRQRIGIARALYKQATVLILDEATSALDDATEAAVMESVASLDRELTIILIAHRLSTVSGCDTIYRLDQGRIVQQGSYQDVVG